MSSVLQEQQTRLGKWKLITKMSTNQVFKIDFAFLLRSVTSNTIQHNNETYNEHKVNLSQTHSQI